ncbi:hypothetical protein [Alcaligenes faecalis]|uniref:HDOD domain-containing protein n=1 Tax=Alcaligenes faecalis TaxID=511 RepID=A0AB33CSG8_ALCFA|nr:hypothetical protein [Alcaligenes faecalis]ASR89079.1 hypothetical protein AFA_06270 [Alcaligenes faecalis]
MWIAQVNRREFFEFYLGSVKNIEKKVHALSEIQPSDKNEITLIWSIDPLEYFSLPCLVIVGDDDVKSLLSSVKAAPQAPTPITALSRIIDQKEAKQHFDSDAISLDSSIFPAIATLILVEGALHGNGKVGLQQLTPLLCKRTLAYAWGRAIGAQSSADSLLELPVRWLDVYSMLNTSAALNVAQRTVSYLTDGLTLLTQLAIGIKPSEPSGQLAFSLLHGNKYEQELAWKSLTACFSRPLSIETIQSMTREERGLQLQEALRALNSDKSQTERETLIAACAFLATKLAPGSLDHFETLKSAALPEILVWYGLYAALQHPKEIMSLHNGMGFRLLRDLLRSEDKIAPPISDIAYLELKIMARMGLEGIAGKVGHASELQVELIPYVSTSFTFQLRNLSRVDEGQQSFDMEPTDIALSPRARATRLAFELSELARDLPDYPGDHSPRKSTRRKSI